MHYLDRLPNSSLNFIAAASASALLLAGSAGGSTPTTTLVSKASGGQPPMCETPESFCYSVHPDITPDGRYVAFASVVPNLVPGDQTPSPTPQIMRHDLHTCTTIRVTETPSGQPADKPCEFPAISADGSVIAFSSRASNLAPGVPNLIGQIYVYDESTSVITLISKSAGGVAGNASCSVPLISNDGRWVAFQSDATNLVPGDTNGATDIFLFDRQTNVLQRVSVGQSGQQSNGASRRPHMSSDGRFIAFDSTATNLTADFFAASPQAFLLDRDANESGTFDQPGGTSLTLQSLSATQQPANGAVWWPSVSDDGQFIAFATTASNLVTGDTNGAMDIFVRDRSINHTTRESVGPGGQQSNVASWFPVRFSSDNRYLTFHSPSHELIAGGHNGMTHVIRRDLLTGANVIVSRNSDGDLADSSSEVGIPNATGNMIAFTSAGNNMIPGGSTNPDWVNTYVRTFRSTDLNGDSVVDVSDLLVLLGQWGVNDCAISDLNGDGVIDVSDLLVLLGDWG